MYEHIVLHMHEPEWRDMQNVVKSDNSLSLSVFLCVYIHATTTAIPGKKSVSAQYN